MKDPAFHSIRSFGATAALHHTRALQEEMQEVRLSQDIEAIHRMRVASRRLRTIFSLFENHFPARQRTSWAKSIRRITHSLGAARDSDVQIELLCALLTEKPPPIVCPGLRRILLRLQQQRTRQQKQVLHILKALEKHQTLAKLQKQLSQSIQVSVPPCPADIFPFAQQTITLHLDAFLQYEPFLNNPECTTELHQMRIAAKRLRYTLETFAECYAGNLKPSLQTLRQAQDALGQIHDCDVWLEILPAFIQKEQQRTIRYFGHSRPLKRLLPGFDFFQQQQIAHRQQIYQQFLQSWKTWQEAQRWNALRETVAIPIASEAK